MFWYDHRLSSKMIATTTGVCHITVLGQNNPLISGGHLALKMSSVQANIFSVLHILVHAAVYTIFQHMLPYSKSLKNITLEYSVSGFLNRKYNL